MSEPKEREEKYWICDDCAKKRGWKCEQNGITVIYGLCGHCERTDETMLIPTCDYNGPGKRAIWD